MLFKLNCLTTSNFLKHKTNLSHLRLLKWPFLLLNTNQPTRNQDFPLRKITTMQDPILIQSFLPLTLNHNPLEFQNNSFLVRSVERQIIRLLIVITAWIFLIKAGIPLLSWQQWQLIIKRNRDLNSHGTLTVVLIITSLLNSKI